MNSIYDDARYKQLTASFNWLSMDLVLSAWAGTPTFNATHSTIGDIKTAGFSELGASLPVTEKTVSANGTAQTNQVLIPEVPIGPDVTWFTLSERYPTHDLSQLILYIDDAFVLPFTPNGMDMLIQPDWLENRGWFRP